MRTTSAVVGTVDVRTTDGKGDAAVHAPAGVTVAFPAGRFTAIMRPSGSGKSALMRCVAGLDRLTSVEADKGAAKLTSMGKTERALRRRDRLGFFFRQCSPTDEPRGREISSWRSPWQTMGPERAWFESIVATVAAVSWCTSSSTLSSPTELHAGPWASGMALVAETDAAEEQTW